MYKRQVLDLPFGKFRDKGQPLDNVSNFDASKEESRLIASVAALKDKKLVFATKTSMLKVVDGGEFDVAKRTTAATKLAPDDGLLLVCLLYTSSLLQGLPEPGHMGSQWRSGVCSRGQGRAI